MSRAVATTHMMRAPGTPALSCTSSADLPSAMQNLPAAMPRKWRVLKFLEVMLGISPHGRENVLEIETADKIWEYDR